MKGKIRWLLTPLVVVALLLSAIPAYAIPPTPHPFYGTIIIGGSAAPVGTEITAKVAGVECGSYTTTVEGQYGSSDPYQDDSLIVQGDIETGAEISFYVTNTELGIDEVQADQTYPFESGASLTELNLTVGVVAPQHSLTVDSSAGGSVTEPGEGVFARDVGAVVDLLAVPDTDYQFVSWTGDVGTVAAVDAASTTITMNDNYSITANFVLVGPEVPVSINAPDNVAEDSDFTATVDIGEVVDLNAAQYDVSFDNTVLRLDDITSGQIDGTEIPLMSTEISPGTWRVVLTMGLGTVSGSGSLAVLHFYVIGSTGESSAIDLSNGMLSGFEDEIPATWTGDLVDIGIDIEPPIVVTKSPEAEATGVAVDTVVLAIFSEAIDETTLVFTLDSIDGTPSYDSGTKTATFTPDANLAYETTYTASIQASDLAGNPMAEAHTWSFTTEAAVDIIPPAVLSTTPEADATNQAINVVVSATFDEDVTAVDLTGITIDGVSVSATLDEATDTITIAHDDFALLTSYTVTIPAGAVEDLATVPNANEEYTWSFTTATASLGELIAGIEPDGTLELPAGTYSGDVIIDKPITISGTVGETIISGGITISELNGSEVIIENLTITDYTAFGIRIVKVRAVDTFIIRNNTIEGVEGSLIGIEVIEVVTGGSLTIRENSISGNEVGIKLMENVADATIHFNDITGNTVYGLEQLAVVSNASAIRNWWADISGPEYEAASFEDWSNPGGLGDAVSDNVDFIPWLTRDFQTVLDDNIAYFGYSMVWLYAGWNIISTPIALDPVVEWEDSDGIARTGVQTWGDYIALGDSLAIDTDATTYYFDGEIQDYVQVLGTYRLEPCDAIYVKMAEDDVAAILLSPSVSVPSKELYAGWNLVSLAWLPTSMEDMYGLPADEALITVEEVTGGLTGYKLVVSPSVNAYEPPWIYIAGDSIEPWTDPELPQPDGWMWITSGYWVFMLNDGTLAGFTFTPVSLGM